MRVENCAREDVALRISLEPEEFFTVKRPGLSFRVKRIEVFPEASFYFYGCRLRPTRLWRDNGAFDQLDHLYRSPYDVVHMAREPAGVINLYRDAYRRNPGGVDLEKFCAMANLTAHT